MAPRPQGSFQYFQGAGGQLCAEMDLLHHFTQEQVLET